jgi:hypothetical protein
MCVNDAYRMALRFIFSLALLKHTADDRFTWIAPESDFTSGSSMIHARNTLA